MKIFKGKITGMKMAKTITVEVERIVAHSLYKRDLNEARNIMCIVKSHIKLEIQLIL